MTSGPEFVNPFGEIIQLEADYKLIEEAYDEADRSTFRLLEIGYPGYLVDAADCVVLLRSHYQGELTPGTVANLFRRANSTARKKENANRDDAPAWVTFSRCFDKYHGTQEFRERTEPGTPAHTEQMLKALIFDSALYLVTQMEIPPRDPLKWV